MSERRHDYPSELTDFVLGKWDAAGHSAHGSGPSGTALPERECLLDLLSVCYQASLMSEEARPISFRLMLGDASLFNPFDGPPDGLQPLVFAKTMPCDENALRRLSPALEFDRSLVGVQVGADGLLEIWGIVHSGARWVHAVQGGRERARPLPDVPVVLVRGPGEISVCRSNDLVATLRRGRVAMPAVNVFDSTWLPGFFADTRRNILDTHAAARSSVGAEWAEVEPEFLATLSQNVVRRVISAIRQDRHGGTILFVRPGLPGDGVGPYVRLGYSFADDPPRRRYRYLLEGALRELASNPSARRTAREKSETGAARVGWDAYVESASKRLSEIDSAVFEIAHLYAGLSGVDGALVLDTNFELLGFGGIISGAIPDVDEVQRSLDVEGEHLITEDVVRVGTRHRSVFRLVATRPDVLAIVVSQDGEVRFVRSHQGRVTYWDQMQETTV